MSDTINPSILDVEQADPEAAGSGTHYNRPGLPALTYQLGTHSALLERMLRRLPNQKVPAESAGEDADRAQDPPLAKLKTRDPSDPAVALLDAWATVAQVLCFYQERIANEGYLPTATESRSVLELARAIGYELNPGVAAGTDLAFTVEQPPDTAAAANVPGMATVPSVVTVPEGTKVMSVPGPGQQPQTFETIEEIEARVEWNALRPREPWTTVEQEIARGTKEICLAGTDTQLEPGDSILIVGEERENDPGAEEWDVRVVTSVTPNVEQGWTQVALERGLGSSKRNVDPAAEPRVFALRQRAALFGHNAPDWRLLPSHVKADCVGKPLAGLSSRPGVVVDFDVGTGVLVVETLPRSGDRREPAKTTINVPEGKRAALASVRAGDMVAGKVKTGAGAVPTAEEIARVASDEWPGFEMQTGPPEVYLDKGYPKVLAGSWVVLVKPSYKELYKVGEAKIGSRTDFALTSQCSHLKLDTDENLALFGGRDLRRTVVYAQSEELALAKVRQDLPMAIDSRRVELGGVVLGLTAGRRLVCSGKRPRVRIDEGGVFRSDDRGEHWEQKIAGLESSDVRALAVGPGNKLYAGGAGGVFCSDDHGDTWSLVGVGLPGTGVCCLAVKGGGPLFAGTNGHGVYELLPDGETWAQTNRGLTNLHVRALAAHEDAGVFAGTADGLFRLAPGADHWEDLALPEGHRSVRALAFGGDNKRPLLYVGTNGGGLSRSATGESAWMPINEAWAGRCVSALAAEAKGTLAIVADSPVCVLKGTRDGWTEVDGPRDAQIRSLAFDSDGQLYAGTAGAGLFRLSELPDGQSRWTRVAEVPEMDVQALVPGESSGMFAAGSHRLVSADRLRSVCLPAGGSLQVLSRPDREGGRWHLRDRNGFEGFAKLAKEGVTMVPAEEDDEAIAEAAVLEHATHTQKRTTLVLKEDLRLCYDRTTLVVHGNVARATHGETVEEVLGNGNGAAAHQRFVLKKPPLTYVPSSSPTGGTSTLEIRVDGVRWDEEPSFWRSGPGAHHCVVRIGDGGREVVAIFGDGQRGARLPSGVENVTARYRTGIGPDGAVDAGSLILLQKRPLGVREVTNPLPATGGAAPESRDQARARAPLSALTLDRIVSLRDFEDFARTVAGIGKAQATVLSHRGRVVHLTVAGEQGQPVEPGSMVHESLVAAIDRAREPTEVVEVASYRPAHFNLAAKVQVDPRLEVEPVLGEVRAVLERAFAYEQRSFGQAVAAAEVVWIIHQVTGVVAVDLDGLYLCTDEGGQQQPSLASLLLAEGARWSDGGFQSAQLLLLNPAGLVLTEMTL